MNKVNHDRAMREQIAALPAGDRPGLLLHACCAPCSSACLERLVPDFAVTVFYYNPNIDEASEYAKRLEEEKRLIWAYNERIRDPRAGTEDAVSPGLRIPAGAEPVPIGILEGRYDPAEFHGAVRGMEDLPEGGERCAVCFRLRLAETARIAAAEGFPYMTTTLTISPLKDADLLNAIGEETARAHGVRWLPSDFKKRDGYRRSIELSQEYGLYRQDYCGCGYSKRERETNNNS